MNFQEEENIVLNGSWENKNRNITAAAYAALVIIGVVYFNVQSILSLVFVAIYKVLFNINISGSYFDKIQRVFTLYKTPILMALVISEFIFMLLPTIWIVKKWHTTEIKKYLRIRLSSFKEILLAVLITILMLPFCYFISYLIVNSLDIPEVLKIWVRNCLLHIQPVNL